MTTDQLEHLRERNRTHGLTPTEAMVLFMEIDRLNKLVVDMQRMQSPSREKLVKVEGILADMADRKQQNETLPKRDFLIG